MSHNILVLQNSDWQKPGKLLAEIAAQTDINLHVVPVWQESAGNFADYDALILLGGDYAVDREDLWPFLGEEKRLIRAWLDLNRPYLGFNIGCHLLASSMGANIGPEEPASVGIIDGHITHEGRLHPLFQGVRTPCKLFKWHEQVVQSPLPRNMVLLATSKDCMVEACCLQGRPHIVGVQCDNYIDVPDDIETWLQHGHDWLNHYQQSQSFAASLMATAREQAARMAEDFTVLLQNFFSLIK